MSLTSNQFTTTERRAPAAPGSLPLREFFAGVWRQWRVGALVCLLVVLYVVSESRIVPPTYRAALKLRIASDRPIASAFQTDMLGLPYSGALQAQCAMIGSQS